MAHRAQGLQDRARVRVHAPDVHLTEPTTISYGRSSFVVDPSTPRTSISGYFLFDIPGASSDSLVYATTPPVERLNPYAAKRVCLGKTPLILTFHARVEPCVVRFIDGATEKFFLFPSGVDQFEQNGDATTCLATSCTTSSTNPLSAPRPTIAPPAILQTLLSSKYDAATLCCSRESWIAPAFAAFTADPTVSTPRFAYMLCLTFSAALFALLSPGEPVDYRDREPILAQTLAKRPSAAAPINAFILYMFRPIAALITPQCNVHLLFDLFLPSAPATLVPMHEAPSHFAQAIPDTLYSFDCFALPPEFIASRQYFIKAGRLYAWSSQLAKYFAAQLVDVRGQTVMRAAAKIQALVFDTIASDLVRPFGARRLPSILRAWLFENNPYVAQMHTMFLVAADATNEFLTPEALIVRMKQGIETAFIRVGISLTSGWLYGKIDIKHIPNGECRVSIRINRMVACIAPSCFNNPHNSDSHLFFIGFIGPESLPTIVRAYSNASGRHPPPPRNRFGLLAKIIVPVDPLEDPIQVTHVE